VSFAPVNQIREWFADQEPPQLVIRFAHAHLSKPDDQPTFQHFYGATLQR
jgi:hypothetical protein